MANKNDEKILLLKKQIDIKREKLEGIKRHTKLTNYIIDFEGGKKNLNILTKGQLVDLLIKLNAYRLSARDLDLLAQAEISGYHVEDWITDIKARLAELNKKDEEKKLAVLEVKLKELLSEEKQVELEIEDIMAKLGE